MALTLLNHFVLQIPDANISFLIADSILALSFAYIQYGIKATKKEIVETEGHRAEAQHEMDKTAEKAQKAALRAAQKAGTKHNGAKQANVEKHYHIQQPSKR
ncbi:hypothetical protein IV203_010860 [Nitzschia inconspicua]|uniref:Uncharacterized protein n=1 Tax=Nitzschia inconspicua TaxID=303405 RepID=A0A9K3KWW3_9STRA|nr:hypothetical protein IV203_010860 [Nitzschia inconspicua]